MIHFRKFGVITNHLSSGVKKKSLCIRSQLGVCFFFIGVILILFKSVFTPIQTLNIKINSPTNKFYSKGIKKKVIRSVFTTNLIRIFSEIFFSVNT